MTVPAMAGKLSVLCMHVITALPHCTHRTMCRLCLGLLGTVKGDTWSGMSVREWICARSCPVVRNEPPTACRPPRLGGLDGLWTNGPGAEQCQVSGARNAGGRGQYPALAPVSSLPFLSSCLPVFPVFPASNLVLFPRPSNASKSLHISAQHRARSPTTDSHGKKTEEQAARPQQA